jgi:hypothetical protein
VVDPALNTVNVFGTTDLPVIETESLGTVGTAEAGIDAVIDAHGTPTAYRVEYGASTAYGSSSAEVSVDSGNEPIAERIVLRGLQPETTYHARVVATSELGSSVGQDIVFTTQPPSTTALPDGRSYELVSPNAASDGNVYIQEPFAGENRDLESQSPFRSAANGESVAYVAEAPPTGGGGSTGDGLGDEFRATRSRSEWSATDIMAPRQQTKEYEGFSSDLSIAALSMYVQPPLTPDAPAKCTVMYLRTVTDEAFHAAFTSTQTPGECGSPVYAGVSADDSHVLFESEGALTAQAHVGAFYSDDNLYETVAGRTYLVSVLPDGEPSTDATFGVSIHFPGGVDLEEQGSNFDRVISPDGARIVWTDLDTEPGPEDPAGTTRLFVREHAESPSATTVQVDAAVGGGGQYRGASSDDSLIFFTKDEKLYRYELETGTTTDLTPGGGVVGVAGISEDGSEIYPVAKTVLAVNANGNGETAQPGNCEITESGPEVQEEKRGVIPPGRACNLYALHSGGSLRFVATLLPTDEHLSGPDGEGSGLLDEFGRYGDWVGNLSLRTSEVSRDGELAFMSKRALTSYDSTSFRETYIYSPADEQLLCASCNPSGEAPSPQKQHGEAKGEALGETYPPTPNTEFGTYQYRWLSANGNRAFFETAEALVPQDHNDSMDVYEWERDGEGSCERPTGCIYLISGATSDTDSYFGDASESGDDVFFSSRADLTAEDTGENVVLYDARVGGGFSHITQACVGTGCQGVPPAAPSFATPPSATFSGIGNYGTPAPPKKSKTTSRAVAKRLAKALKSCRAKHDRKKRAICERSARKRYGPSARAKKATVVSPVSGEQQRSKR